MKTSRINAIKIEGRGRYRDEFGNPYYAWRADIDVQIKSHHSKVTIYESMAWGDSYESAVLRSAVEGINEALDINIKQNDRRISYTYKHVSGDAPLRKPLKWKQQS